MRLPTLILCGASLFLAPAGCSRKTEAINALAAAACALEQPAPSQAPPPAALQPVEPALAPAASLPRK